MKRLITTIILLVSANILLSQVYQKFPTSNALWNHLVTGSLSYPYEWQVIDSLGEQTTIGNHEYSEVYRAKFGDSDIVGAIREDTLLRKVYFNNFSDETVLYDFTLEIGDTIFYSTNLFYNVDYYKVVNNIDSISINGQLRKRWHLTNSLMNMTDIWIEGIGSVYRYGLLYPLDPDLVLDGSTTYFGCFTDNIITYLDNANCSGTCPCSEWLVDVNEMKTMNEGINMFPNPTSNTINIHFKNEAIYNYLEIYNYNGELIEGFEIKSKKNIQIDAKSFINGIYFIKLTGEEKTALKTFIKK